MQRVTFLVQRDCPACGARFRVRVDTEGRLAQAAGPPLPFCSERCRLIDLGLWLEEEYRISQPLGEIEPTEQ